jgi:hypothetical protein
MFKSDRPLKFALVTNDQPARVAQAEELARQLSAAGASVEVQRIGWVGFIADVLPGRRFGAALVETFEPNAMPDPERIWARDSALNLGGWTSQRSEDALAALRRATTSDARASALRDWRAVFDAEGPAIRLLHPGLSYPVAIELKGQAIPPLVLPRDRFASYADWYLFTKRAPGRF